MVIADRPTNRDAPGIDDISMFTLRIEQNKVNLAKAQEYRKTYINK